MFLSTDHLDTIVQAKSDLETLGIDLSGPCGAFEIVNLAALRLKPEGVGLLQKPSGINCNNLAVTMLFFQDGQAYDVLDSPGVDNTPVWRYVGLLDVDRWRPAHIRILSPTSPSGPNDFEERLSRLERWIVSARKRSSL